jgi:lysozyme
MELGDKGIKLIKHFEKCRLTAYQDAKGVWTIGWGNTYYENKVAVKKGDTVMQAEADKLFTAITANFVADVNRLTKGTVLKQQQFDALVSFAYNVGSDKGLGESTLLKILKENPKDPVIAGEFLKWNLSGGKVLDGLTRRRKAEAYLYFAGELEFFE